MCHHGFSPPLHPGGGNHHAFFGVLHGFHRQRNQCTRRQYTMVLRLCSQRSAILRAARLSFVASFSEGSIVIVPAEPLPFGVACWLTILSSEVISLWSFLCQKLSKTSKCPVHSRSNRKLLNT
ncbi:hypothetical protein NSPZN2_11035 [Nitrospira defluvii]|uniref:Uncharacterized protein n=1 Tax=Nitrospira defluvii TaxID=330214 RepID=A0ABM8QNS1_9BACT|nr:hypothetical protein NSPZN2_11035 [Nitrospira defluvii]